MKIFSIQLTVILTAENKRNQVRSQFGFFPPEEGRLVLPVKTQDSFAFAALLLMFNFVL